MAKKTNCTINGIDYYRIRKTIGYDKYGEPIVKPFYGKNKSDAERKANNWMVNQKKGLRIDGNQSLTQAMFTWLWNIEKPSGLKSSTFERYEGIYRNHIDNTRLGFSQLDELDQISVQQHYREMYDSDKTYSMIQNCNKVLNKFFRYCLSEGHILHNPCFGIKFDAYSENNEFTIEDELKEEGKIESYDMDEIRKITKSDYNLKTKIIAKLVLGTGLRQGEVLALNIGDVDLDKLEVRVTKTLTYMKIYDSPEEHHREWVVTKPKSKKSRRIVPIPTELVPDLKYMRVIRNEQRLLIGEAYRDNDLMFPSELGNYTDARNHLRSWKRALEKIGVEYKGFHALRHTYATQLIRQNVPLLTVSRLLGHSDIKTTQRYTHILQHSKAEDVQVLNELFV